MAQHRLLQLSNTTPTRITPNGTHGGMDLTLQNVNDSGYIYIGGDDTLSSTNYGFRIMPNHSISFELPGTDAMYAIAFASNMNLAVIETGLESQD
ncbi:MAG: hypothetical protein ACK5P0_00045 [bacterium]